MKWLTPDAWMPILAVIGICLLMFSKRGRKKDIGAILLGFAVLMTGMDLMSSAVSGLKDDAGFASILTMFSNPLLGVLAGAVLTAIIQSSSASVGILQSLATTGQISYGMAIPIIMGQNIGTCITAILSSIGANTNGKRSAFIQLYFNVIGTVIMLIPFCIVRYFVDLAIINAPINMWGIATVHTMFNILVALILGPVHKWLEKLAVATIKDKEEKNEKTHLLDERLFATPSVAAESAAVVTRSMAKMASESLEKALTLFNSYDAKVAEEVRKLEEKADVYEDVISSYLVKLSSHDMSTQDSNLVNKLLHVIGDFERISDHAVNIVESAEEMRDKKIEFSSEAKRQISVMERAVSDIVKMTCKAFEENDTELAINIEPLEEVVDELRDKIKKGHVIRLQKSECSIEHGFVLSDILTNFERVSDHCSNIAGCIIELSEYDSLNVHEYVDKAKHSDETFRSMFEEYRNKYVI